MGEAATAAAIKSVIYVLKLADIKALIGILQSTQRDLNASCKGLSTIRPLTRNVLSAAEGMESTATKMSDRLEVILSDV